MIREIRHEGRLLALIVRHEFNKSGVHFFTPGDLSQQLAYLHHPTGKVIDAHLHKPFRREVHDTLEVLLVKRGRLRVDIYDVSRTYIESTILEAGDVILLSAGGHGFEVLEEVELFEVRQGPYSAEEDKTRFPSVRPEDIRLNTSS
jgi:mannose-6-phosphate isomerase-like protein (cupin superfamily)